MSKFRFRYNKKTAHIMIPDIHLGDKYEISHWAYHNFIKTSGYFTDEEIVKIGNIPIGTLMNMFKQIN